MFRLRNKKIHWYVFLTKSLQYIKSIIDYFLVDTTSLALCHSCQIMDKSSMTMTPDHYPICFNLPCVQKVPNCSFVHAKGFVNTGLDIQIFE